MTAPMLRYTVVEIPIAAQDESTPLRQISEISHSRAPHVGHARHDRSTRRWDPLMPGGKTI